MRPGALKDTLMQCLEDKDASFFTPHPFSVGHRGAALMFPEHTAESYKAAITMGAGVVECDVAVTKDGELVCRHSQCDLHTTTNILDTPLASKCTQPFVPADPVAGTNAKATCCTSDITLAEFKTLCGKMDSYVSSATTVSEYMGGTANYRTDLYATCATVVTHSESIALINAKGRWFTPELKTYTQGPGMPTYDAIRHKMIQEYRDHGVPASKVWPQSFNRPDIEYWINNEGEFGPHAVMLDGDYTDGSSGGLMNDFASLKAAGVRILAPPMQMLVKVENNQYKPSNYAITAKNMGFDIITWTLERSGPLKTGGGFYYGTSVGYTMFDGDALHLTDVLAREVGVLGLFSDWPATTTFYANCMLKDLKAAGEMCRADMPDCAIGTKCVCDSSRRLLFASTGGHCECK